ncbi:MAG TPA: DUF4332 domain-containing protein [Clostridia bacterium]|nr:DUF4332 domain-containing protein [Clostridia bacterium]
MYSIDISKIELLRYKEILKNKYLIPSRKVLLDCIDENFDSIISLGIDNISKLKKELDNETGIINISEKTKIPIEYLNILRREIGSIKSKTIKLLDFSEIFNNYILNILNNNGIKNSKQFYESFQKRDNKIFNLEIPSKHSSEPEDLKEQKELAEEKHIEKQKQLEIQKEQEKQKEQEHEQIEALKELEELFILCDFIRMDGIGILAAKAFFEAGYKSISEIAEDNSENMLIKISNINKDNKYFKTKLGKNDMQYCIDSAKLICDFENI